MAEPSTTDRSPTDLHAPAPAPAVAGLPRSRRRRRALALLGWALLYAAILAGIALHRSPRRIGPREVPMQGGSAFPEARSDALALLVLPPAFAAPASSAPGAAGATAAGRAASAARFSTLEPAQAWGNWLLQEFGSLRTATVADLDTLALDRLALVVVPQACGAGLAETVRARLQAFAQRGGVVLWERGPPTTDSRDPARGPAALSWLATGLADSTLAARLSELPLAGAATGELDPLSSWEPLLRAQPAAVPRDAGRSGGRASAPPPRDETTLASAGRRGQGGEVLLDLPFARHLLTWQQGRPADDFAIPLRHRAEAGVPFCQPNALVPDPRLLETLYPHADAWERLLAVCIESVRPVPRLWYFPYAYDGAWAMTHDDEDFGDLSRWMTLEENRQGAASTLYIIPRRITAQGAADMAADGCDLALHWWRGWSADLTRPVGVFGWTPLRRVWSLTEQRDRLQSLLPAGSGPIISNRVHGLMWDAHYTRDFRRLEAAGFKLDSTYGPAGRKQLGYQFGTGFPFHPLDTDGRPFRLLEVPFLYQDDENWRPDLDEELLRDSAGSLHQLLVPLYHATTMRWTPSAEVMDGYLASFDRARRWNHWVTTLEGYRRFWERRAGARIARGERPGEYVVPGGADSAGSGEDDAAGGGRTARGDEAGEADSGLALMVPPGARLLAADGKEPAGRTIVLMGRAYRLVPLAALGGRFTLEARP